MKYIVLLCDGMADEKIESIGNKTIMEAANIPLFDKMASNGTCGLIHTTPDGMPPGSDICNLSIFGYNPKNVYTGRSPLEAASIGVHLDENDMAFRCNLVTLSENGKVMEDFSGHHVSNEAANEIINALNKHFKGSKVEFYSGVGYRNLMIVRDCDIELRTTPPHDISGREIGEYLPKGKGEDFILDIMKIGADIASNIGNSKVNAIWLWGEGKKPKLKAFKDLYGLKGAVIAAVDLIKGIGINAGLDIINVPGATGFIDTNFKGKAEYAVNALKDNDYVFIHVEAPDEAGHMGSVAEKIKAAENINNIMLPILLDFVEKEKNVRILVTPDHPTPIKIKTHSSSPVPAIIYGKNVRADGNKEYNEFIKPSFDFKEGYKIAEFLIKEPLI
jgi:2,3-bisphosphoglycerate-independent phosphoglycerate mutase